MDIFYTVNAGLYLRGASAGILVDGVHGGAQEGFSQTPGVLMEELTSGNGRFRDLRALLFTHLHPDHFDGRMMREVLRAHPDIAVYGPALRESNLRTSLLRRGASFAEIGDMRILMLDTPHDGKNYGTYPHQSFVIEAEDMAVFVAGDAVLEEADEARIRELYARPVQIAFINVYQIFSESARAFLHALRPARICLYHLPFEADDLYNYRNMTTQGFHKFKKELPQLEMAECMQWTNPQRA